MYKMSNILRICISNRQKIFYDIHQELFNEADPKVKFHKGELTNSNLTVLILLLKALSYHQKKKSDKALLCIGLTIRNFNPLFASLEKGGGLPQASRRDSAELYGI